MYISVTETRRRCLFRLCEDYNLMFCLVVLFVCVEGSHLLPCFRVCVSECQTALSLQENGRQSNTNTRIYTQTSHCIALLRCFSSRFLMYAHATKCSIVTSNACTKVVCVCVYVYVYIYIYIYIYI